MKEEFEYSDTCGKRNGVIIFWKRQFTILVYSQKQDVELPIGQFTNFRPNERTKAISKN
jgi:hypothetical protein